MAKTAKTLATSGGDGVEYPGSDRVSVRFGRKLKAASAKAAKAAGCATLGEWLRGLAEKATGVDAPMPRGMAGLTKRARTKIGKGGRAARWARFELLKMGAEYDEKRDAWLYCGNVYRGSAVDALASIRGEGAPTVAG